MKKIQLLFLLFLGALTPCLPINSMQRDLKTMLEFVFFAIENDNLTVLKILYNRNKTIIHAVSQTGIPLLHHATFHAAARCTKFILEKGGDKNIRGPQNATALIAAVAFNKPKIVELLCKYGANLELSIGDDYTPLLLAVYRNHFQCVQVLLQYNVNIDATVDGDTALMLATKFRNVDMVKLLCAHCANVNARNDYYETPLSIAHRNNDLACADVLLQYGATMDGKKSITF